VYLCLTDEETVTNARAGHILARETPTHAELGIVTIKTPSGSPRVLPYMDGTLEQEEARRRRHHELAIDRAIEAVRYSSRDCPQCGYPVADYRVYCQVCWFGIGRDLEEYVTLCWISGRE
jgi:hypothetical protein